MISRQLMLCCVIVVGAAAGAGTPLPAHGADKGPDVVVATQLANELFDSAGYWFSGRIAVWPIDAKAMPAIGLPEQPSLMIADEVRAAVQHVGLARGYKFVERAAISKVFAEQQFAQGRTDAEFAKLARASGADAVAITSILRKEPPGLAIVSVRLVMATGGKQGSVVAASSTHDFQFVRPSAAEFLGLKPPPQPVVHWTPEMLGLKPPTSPVIISPPAPAPRIVEDHPYRHTAPPIVVDPGPQLHDYYRNGKHVGILEDDGDGHFILHRDNGRDTIIEMMTDQ